MKHKILIIDDEASFTEVVKLSLEQRGSYEVLIENEALNSLEAVLAHRPELILLDVIMPEMEGPDVLNLIRRHEQARNIPVIFLTATIRPEEVEAHDGLIGGHSFMAKPGSVEELVRSIEEAILNFKVSRF